jgi:hypothetical protein
VRERWLSRRAVGLHLLLAVVFPMCLLAGWWQVNRALSGNFLSYLYSVEWPIFAILAAVAWWQLIHDAPVQAEPTGVPHSELVPPEEGGFARGLPVWDPALETPELRAYNERLRQLAQQGGRKTWRNPRGLPEPEQGEREAVVP